MELRSGCPINLSLEVIGDKWSLVVLRDLMFGNQRSFGELLSGNLEGIASNILASRLRSLQAEGMITRAGVPGHKQKGRYSLTEKAIALVPVMAALGAWGRRYLPSTPELSIRAQLLEEGGPEMWEAFKDDLRVAHLGASSTRSGPTVGERLQTAYEAVVREQAG